MSRELSDSAGAMRSIIPCSEWPSGSEGMDGGDDGESDVMSMTLARGGGEGVAMSIISADDDGDGVAMSITFAGVDGEGVVISIASALDWPV